MLCLFSFVRTRPLAYVDYTPENWENKSVDIAHSQLTEAAPNVAGGGIELKENRLIENLLVDATAADGGSCSPAAPLLSSALLRLVLLLFVRPILLSAFFMAIHPLVSVSTSALQAKQNVCYLVFVPLCSHEAFRNHSFSHRRLACWVVASFWSLRSTNRHKFRRIVPRFFGRVLGSWLPP